MIMLLRYVTLTVLSFSLGADATEWIGYVLNASNTCPKPDFIPESHFCECL